MTKFAMFTYAFYYTRSISDAISLNYYFQVIFTAELIS